MKILLVEDDEIFAQHVSTYLTSQNYTVEVVADADQGAQYAQSTRYDLIILDVVLPDQDGISLCRTLRREGYNGAILLLTIKRDGASKIQGLDAGADDYVVKNCPLEEIGARIRALLRRPRETGDPVLRWGPLQLDPSTCQIHYQDREIFLSPKEYGLLELFLRYPQRIFSSETLLERLWSFDETPGEEAVRAHIKRLRRKLNQVGAGRIVENIYGIGYRLAPPPDPRSALEPEANRAPEDAAASEASPDTPKGQQITPGAKSPAAAQAAARAAAVAALSQFRTVVLERLAVLTEAATALRHSTWSVNMHQRAYYAAHKLAGSLGMFGLTQASDLSRQIETYLNPTAAGGATQPDQAVEQLISQLQETLDGALASAGEEADEKASEPPPPQAVATREDVSPSPSLLVISANTDWIAELATIAGDRLHVFSADGLAAAQQHLLQPQFSMILVDMATFPAAAAALSFLKNLNETQGYPLIFVRPYPDTFQTRLDITRHSDRWICLSSTLTVQHTVDTILQEHRNLLDRDIRVLAVDDDQLSLETIKYTLTARGMKVTTLYDPRQLWDVLLQIEPDVLLLDFRMPDIDGAEICRLIRSDRSWHRLPIIFFSGLRDSEIIQRAYRAGADDYVIKPFAGSELSTRILNRIRRNQVFES